MHVFQAFQMALSGSRENLHIKLWTLSFQGRSKLKCNITTSDANSSEPFLLKMIITPLFYHIEMTKSILLYLDNNKYLLCFLKLVKPLNQSLGGY